LQEGTIRRVGATNEIQVTARIIAASNRNLEEAVKVGQFREDLYYRLGMPLRIPPLRERVEDIPILTSFFSQRFSKPMNFDEEAMRALCSYAWPGNVRELESIISKLATFVGQQIRLDDLLAYLPIARERLGHHLCLPLLSYLNATMAGELMSYQALKHRYVIEAFLYYRRESRVARLMKMDYRTVINILQSEEAQAIFRSLGVEYHPMKEEEESLPLFTQE
jgi:transcriptional regulator with GAF, ATPase, and Fis domain